MFLIVFVSVNLTVSFWNYYTLNLYSFILDLIEVISLYIFQVVEQRIQHVTQYEMYNLLYWVHVMDVQENIHRGPAKYFYVPLMSVEYNFKWLLLFMKKTLKRSDVKPQ